MKPLRDIAEEKTIRIVKIDAGKDLSGRISCLGLREGDLIRVIHNARGPLIIAKDALRFAIGRGMSSRILVEEP